MEFLEKRLIKDIEKIQSLEIIPAILELICQTTGMGFSAVARVTDEKWIACAVNDKISFGLAPGGELKLETTICNEIRQHHQPVVIDEVSKDVLFSGHHTPKMYGFQSYISIPITLKDGTFFGTLCAIDPKPRSLKSSNMVTMFNLYADLISFHLQSQERIATKNTLLQITESKLKDSMDDIRQYAYVSRHSLQEPLRKLQIFSELITRDKSLPADHKVKNLAAKVNVLAADFSDMMQHLFVFSETLSNTDGFQMVDLNVLLQSVLTKLAPKISTKKAIVDVGLLHTIYGISSQLSLAFYYIIDNALNFSRPNIAPVIKIHATDIDGKALEALGYKAVYTSYCKVSFEDNGIGINNAYLEQIFDLFSRLNTKEEFPGLGMGLSQTKKVMRNHDGLIVAQSVPDSGSVFSLIFPVNKQINTAM
jgi:signal transduction histidine kinase